MAERPILEAMARAVFVADHPPHMMDADWDSGAVLGAENGYRKHCYTVALAVLRSLAEAEPTPGMVHDGAHAVLDTEGQSGTVAEETFRAMIRALLEEVEARHPSPSPVESER